MLWVGILVPAEASDLDPSPEFKHSQKPYKKCMGFPPRLLKNGGLEGLESAWLSYPNIS